MTVIPLRCYELEECLKPKISPIDLPKVHRKEIEKEEGLEFRNLENSEERDEIIGSYLP